VGRSITAPPKRVSLEPLVNCVAPGVIETDMTENIHAEEAKKLIPMGRFGQVEDIAATVDFLMSDSAGYLTRQVISVNGGMC